MNISYNKLWKLLIDKNMKKKDLKNLANISSSSLAKLGKNEIVSLEVLIKVCIALNCDFGDVIQIVNEERKDEKGC